jgi:hypothetical protein
MNEKTPLEWYRILLILIGAFGIVLAFINWYTSGSDIPNGLLTILSLIISAALGPNAVSSVASTFKNSRNSKEDSEVVTQVNIVTEPSKSSNVTSQGPSIVTPTPTETYDAELPTLAPESSDISKETQGGGA